MAKILYNDVIKQIEQAPIGSMVEVLVQNKTRHTGSPAYYTRKGILVDKTIDSIKVEINGRKFNMNLRHGIDWIGEYPNSYWVENEYASGLYSVRVLSNEENI